MIGSHVCVKNPTSTSSYITPVSLVELRVRVAIACGVTYQIVAPGDDERNPDIMLVVAGKFPYSVSYGCWGPDECRLFNVISIGSNFRSEQNVG